jgi:hypothetical protein
MTSLETRLKEATAEDSGQMLKEFLKAFFLHKSEVAVEKRPFPLNEPEWKD